MAGISLPAPPSWPARAWVRTSDHQVALIWQQHRALLAVCMEPAATCRPGLVTAAVTACGMLGPPRIFGPDRSWKLVGRHRTAGETPSDRAQVGRCCAAVRGPGLACLPRRGSWRDCTARGCPAARLLVRPGRLPSTWRPSGIASLADGGLHRPRAHREVVAGGAESQRDPGDGPDNRLGQDGAVGAAARACRPGRGARILLRAVSRRAG
jgi:hypothetical protein